MMIVNYYTFKFNIYKWPYFILCVLWICVQVNETNEMYKNN